MNAARNYLMLTKRAETWVWIENVLVRISDILTRTAALASGLIVVAMVAFIIYEICLRTIFDSSTYVLDEFVGYGVAAMTFLAFAKTLRDGEFIRLNLVISHFGPTLRQWVETTSCFLGTLLFCFVTYAFGSLVFRDFQRGTVSNSIAETPLWIPESIILTGLVIFTLQFVVLTLRRISGDFRAAPHKEL